MPTDPPQLDYAPKTRSHRNRWLLLILFLLIAPFGSVAARWTHLAYARLQIQSLYRRCATDVRPATHVVFSSTEGSIRTVTYAPSYWLELNRTASNISIGSVGTAFLHELRKTNGDRRLIGIDIIPPRGIHLGDDVIYLEPCVYAPASLLHLPSKVSEGQTSLRQRLSTAKSIQIYAGQPDLGDPSHFTIPFTLDGEAGVIDGYLQNDDSVTLKARRTSATRGVQ
jgi:hypothetical protein